MDASVMSTTKTQSPFLPGTKVQFAWDSTSLGYLKTCPRLYQYIMIDGWGHAEESVHLRFGQEYHQALQDYDLSRAAKIKHEDALHDVVRELLLRTADFAPDPLTKAGKYKSRKALVRVVIDYLDEHRDDPAKTYIKADGKPAVELSFRFELDWGPNCAYVDPPNISTNASPQPYLLCGHLDRVVDFNGSMFVMDHKTTTSTPGSNYFDQWSPNNQMSLYSFASQVVINSPVKGVIINAAQLMVDSSRFVRGFTYRTPDQLGEWINDLRYWLDLAERYAEADHWPMNDTACNNFGGCRFRDVCSKSPQVREQFLKSDFDHLEEADRWNPLKPR
jgi:PD-(D/E)XK nuclease superfamily